MKNKIFVNKGSYARRLVMPNPKAAPGDETDLMRNSRILTSCDSTESSNHDLLNLRLCWDEAFRDSNRTAKTPSPRKTLLSGPCLEEYVLRPIAMASVPASNLRTSRSPSTSPNGLAYAAAKFNESPSAKVLPRPPSHWVGSPKVVDCGAIESELKVMLRVQC